MVCTLHALARKMQLLYLDVRMFISQSRTFLSYMFVGLIFSESCPEFCSSGSGIVRAWAKRNDVRGFSVDQSLDTDLLQSNSVDQYQYSFVGPLSMHKGCDRAFHMYEERKYSKSSQGLPPNSGFSYDNTNIGYRGKVTKAKYTHFSIEM